MANTPLPIGYYSWLFGYLNYPYGAEYAQSDIFGVRELPSDILRPREDLVQVQVRAFDGLAWINVSRRDVVVETQNA